MIGEKEIFWRSLQETELFCSCTKCLFILQSNQFYFIENYLRSIWNYIFNIFFVCNYYSSKVCPIWNIQTHFCSRYRRYEAKLILAIRSGYFCFFLEGNLFSRQEKIKCVVQTQNICGEMWSIFSILDNFMLIKGRG